MTDGPHGRGYPDLNALGKSHTARLAGGDVLSEPTVVHADVLADARARKIIRERKVTSRSDAFRGKDD